MGVGGFLLSNQFDPFSELKTGLNAAIHVPIAAKTSLSLGFAGGFHTNRIDLSSIVLRDMVNDLTYQSLLLNGESNTFFNLNSGIALYAENYYLGYGTGAVGSYDHLREQGYWCSKS